MRNYEPVAFCYEADIHCPHCAYKRFGRCEEHYDIACCCRDNEGNEPRAIFSWDENPYYPDGMFCGDCSDEIFPGEDKNNDEDDGR